MEMERVPAAGYEIIGLPVSGFDRHNPLRNIKVLYMAPVAQHDKSPRYRAALPSRHRNRE